MPITGKYLLSVGVDVDPAREAIFNEVYDGEHLRFMQAVPGVLSVARFQTQELTLFLAGQKQTIRVEDQPKYTAFYELESPEVLTSEAWAKAVDGGRWPTEVRPYTRNRREVLLQLIYPR